MGFLKSLIFEALLTESQVEIPQIESSLDNHSIIRLNYTAPEGDKIAPGERNIYPIAYGLSLKGNPVIRAYQPNGDTASKVPSWKLFRIDGIDSWEDTGEKYTTRDIPDLRLKHDDGMSVEYKAAFGGENKVEPNAPEDNRYDSTPVTKQEVENPRELSKTAKQEPAQNTTVQNPTGNVDNATENPHIPIGISPNTTTAPDNKPVSQNNPVFEPTDNTNAEPNEEEPTIQAPASEPIMQNDNEEEDEEDEVNKINSLTERINRLRR